VTAGATSRSLADAAWLTAGALPRLLGVLDNDGEEARVVGGAVRNALIGMPIAEIDVATTAVPDEVVNTEVVSARTSVIGNEHWDDGLPVRMNGKDAYGMFYSGLPQAISGDVYVTPGQGLTKTPASTITIDLTTLTSDSPMRDGFIKRSTLQTDQFPRATYTVTGIDGFPASYHEGDEVKVTVNGTLQVHGVEKPVAWTGTARYAGQQLEAVLSADVTMTMFGMTPPQVPIVQSVDDKVHLDLHLVLQQQAA